jgi:lauroyl/myristoyl acyltransferase
MEEVSRMAKARNRFADYAVYCAIRLTVALLRMLSFGMAIRAADGLAWVAHRVDRRHRLVARENLQFAFPETHSETELDSLVRGVYR